MFASWIPEITELAANRSKYGGQYQRERKRYFFFLPPFARFADLIFFDNPLGFYFFSFLVLMSAS